MGDFKSFYCSARVLLEREDPYATAPLSRCESEDAPAPLFVTKPGEVLPAPLPGYVVAAFVPFALVPFAVACAVWLLLSIAAIAAGAILFERAGIAGAWTVAVGLALLFAADCLPVGELPPIAFAGVALAVWGTRERRSWPIAFGVALAFTEPQIGIALFVAACAVGRSTAFPALGAVVVLAVVSLLTMGVAGNLEYVRVVLPAHLLSELPSVLQYSLSWMLYRIGLSASSAILAGRLCWVLMLCVTVAFARTAFARARPEIALLAAPAFAVVGGPFLHLDHIALAVPAALWLARQHPSPLRIGALLGLTVPVLYVFSIIALFALVPFVAGWLATSACRATIAGLRAALCAIVVLAIIGAISVHAGTGSLQIPPVQPLPATLPQAAWAAYVGKHFVMNGWAIWLVKAPMWLAILATASGFVRLGGARVRTAAQ